MNDLDKPFAPRRNDLNVQESLLLGKYGVKGYGVLSLLLQEINKSYYLRFNEEIGSMLAKRWNTSAGLVSDIVKDSLNWGIFSIEKFDKYGILTNEEVQENHFRAVSKREFFIIEKDILLSSVLLKLLKNKKFKSFFEGKSEKSDREEETKQDETKQDETKENESKDEQLSLSFEKFKKAYPEKCMGYDDYMPEPNIDFDLLATKIEESPQFLKICNNLDLKWLTKQKNYENVLNDKYKDKSAKNIIFTSHSSKGRTYTPNELNSLFDSLEDFEI